MAGSFHDAPCRLRPHQPGVPEKEGNGRRTPYREEIAASFILYPRYIIILSNEEHTS